MPFIKDTRTGKQQVVSMAYVAGHHVGNNIANPDDPNSLLSFSQTTLLRTIERNFPALSRPLVFNNDLTIASKTQELQDFEPADQVNLRTMEHTHRFTLRDSDHVGPSQSTLEFLGFQNVPNFATIGRIEMPKGHTGGLNYYQDSINGGTRPGTSFAEIRGNRLVGRGAEALMSTAIKNDGKYYWEMKITKMPTSVDSAGNNPVAWNMTQYPITDNYEGGSTTGQYRPKTGADVEILFARKDFDRNREWHDGSVQAAYGQSGWEVFGFYLRSFELITSFNKRRASGSPAGLPRFNFQGSINDSNETDHTQVGDTLMFAYNGVPDVNGQTRLFLGRNGTWYDAEPGDSAYFRNPAGFGSSYNPAHDSATAPLQGEILGSTVYGFGRPGAMFLADRDRDLRMFISPLFGLEAQDSNGVPQQNSSIDFGFKIQTDSALEYPIPAGYASH